MLERARQWAVRCAHEAQMWRHNSFVTLTYDAEQVPRLSDGRLTLRPGDFVRFMKRLRKLRYERWLLEHQDPGEVYLGIRFLQAGEYGALGRPHHHALLFNCDFEDRVRFRETKSGSLIFRSAELERLWPFGFCSVGEVTFESAGYVARYTLKKAGAVDREARQDRGGREAGPVGEYLTMSRRPGIGALWYEKFKGDVFPLDEVVTRGGKVVKPPRFYLERLEKEDPRGWDAVRAGRLASAEEVMSSGEGDGYRLYAKQENVRRRIKDFLKREV